MTISGDTVGDTVCSIIQAFPVLLILAQSHYRCLHTPLIYKPPTPTHPPEFYEAYATLLEHLYGHEHGGDHSHGHGYNHGYGHDHSYGHGSGHGHIPEHAYGYGHGQGYDCHDHAYGHNYGYNHNYKKIPQVHHHNPCHYHPVHKPTYVVTNGYPHFKKLNVYNVTVGKKGYAPSQAYGTVNNKYKIVMKIKKNKGKRQRPQKIVEDKEGIQGVFNQRREENGRRYDQSVSNFVPNTVSRLSTILHFDQYEPKRSQFVFPFDSRRPVQNNPYYNQYDAYGRPNNNGFNQYRPEYNNYPNYQPPGNYGYQNNNQYGFQNSNPVPNIPHNFPTSNDGYTYGNMQSSQENSGFGNNNNNQYRPIKEIVDEIPKFEDRNGEFILPNDQTNTGLAELTPVPNSGSSFDVSSVTPNSTNQIFSSTQLAELTPVPKEDGAVGFPVFDKPAEFPAITFAPLATSPQELTPVANNGFPIFSPLSTTPYAANSNGFPTFSPLSTKPYVLELTPVPQNANGFTEAPKVTTPDLQELTPVPQDSDAIGFPAFDPLPGVKPVTSRPSETTTNLPELTPVPVPKSAVNFDNFPDSCTTVDGGFGTCTAISNCWQYVSLLKEAQTNPAAVQLLRRAHCGFEGSNPKVCCPASAIPSDAPPSPAPPATPETPPEPEQPFSGFPDPPVCGSSDASLGRVVGGKPAKLGDFPWMALLGYRQRRSPEPRWLCGGSLITSKHVLTAAHCIHGREKDLYQVRLGELDLSSDDDGATPIDIPIKKLIKHEEYSPTGFTNDIGVLLLERQVAFTSLIKPICIPTDSELRARSFENFTPIIAGWGDTEFRGTSASHLQALQLPVVSNDFCRQAYVKYKAQTIDNRVLCAGYKMGGKDACQGDSGGPLMQPIWNKVTYKTHFYQIGVVSFGKKCAEPGFPGVYSRVTHFVPWLQKVVQDTASS